MSTYRARFDAFAATIESQPYLVIEEYCARDGASEAAIASFQHDLGAPLDEAAKAFYREADGLTLRWGFDKRAKPNRLR